MACPLPPLKEQAEIVRKARAALEGIKSLEILLSKTNIELSQLAQSILAKAFRGELVPQDPNDEPVSELLARIRATREAAEAQKKTAKKKSKPTKRKSAKTKTKAQA